MQRATDKEVQHEEKNMCYLGRSYISVIQLANSQLSM